MNIKRGDRIRITRWGSVWRDGLVLTANNYPEPADLKAYEEGLSEELRDNWFIEFTDLDGTGYHYWKQDPDGGTVEVL